jgi:hypothetical protein
MEFSVRGRGSVHIFVDFLAFTSAKGNSVRCQYRNKIEQKSDIRNNGTRRSNYQTVINSIHRVSLLREEFFLLIFSKGGSTSGNTPSANFGGGFIKGTI